VNVVSSLALGRQAPADALAPALAAIAGRRSSRPRRPNERQAVEAVYVHVDLDVLDPTMAPAVDYAAPGGLEPDELIQALHAVGERFGVVAVSLTAFDPEQPDPDGRTLRQALEILRELVAVGHWSNLGGNAMTELSMDCLAELGDQSGRGTLSLDDDRLEFAGSFRLTLQLSEITAVRVHRGRLELVWPQGHAAFDLGRAAQDWAEALGTRRSLLDRLGVKPAPWSWSPAWTISSSAVSFANGRAPCSTGARRWPPSRNRAAYAAASVRSSRCRR